MSNRTKTIIVIDDERTVQATLTAVLQRHGFAVEVAPNAAQGRRKVEVRKPDLVLLDLELPDAGGLELLRELKAIQPGLPVMILTAHDSLANAIESIKLGAFHFLPKPYAVEELVGLCPPCAGAAGARRKSGGTGTGEDGVAGQTPRSPRSSLRRLRSAGVCVRWTDPDAGRAEPGKRPAYRRKRRGQGDLRPADPRAEYASGRADGGAELRGVSGEHDRSGAVWL